MSRPSVSFVVPCYNYGHYLRECVDSILEQTCKDVEVLIMDDCSPDNTPEVAASIQDPRVIHVRHPVNLGAVENINVGVQRARGRYIWVLSPDDKFARADALAHFVKLMDQHPTAGIGFSQAHRLSDAGVNGVFETEAHNHLRKLVPTDGGMIAGAELFRMLLGFNFMPAPTVLIRREFYERRGLWRADVRCCPDWHTWARVAMEHDAVYWPESALHYRVHQDSEWHTYVREQAQRLKRDCIKIRWLLQDEAEKIGLGKLAGMARDHALYDYQYRVHQGSLGNDVAGLSPAELEESLNEFCSSPRQRAILRGQVFAYVGNQYCKSGEYEQALVWYRLALGSRPWHPKTFLLCALLRTGGLGRHVLRLLIRGRIGAGNAVA